MFGLRISRLGVRLGLSISASIAGAATLSRPAEAASGLASTPKIALHYFPIQGPAEPIRLALVVGGVPFDDIRHTRAEMLAMKEAGELPYGQLPIAYIDGKRLAQSNAIGQYCAKVAGLVPADAFQAAKCDEIIQYIQQDVRERVIGPTMRESDAAKKAEMRKKAATVGLPEKLAILEKAVQPSGYLVGDALTMADLHFYVLANWIGMGTLDGIPKDVILAFPKLTNLVKKLNDTPQIKKWNAEKNPKLPWC